MNTRVWHKGPPPHIGWWNASNSRELSTWRWWNGVWWSRWASAYSNGDSALRDSRYEDRDQLDIEWTHYYPENARVPRVNPSKGESL